MKERNHTENYNEDDWLLHPGFNRSLSIPFFAVHSSTYFVEDWEREKDPTKVSTKVSWSAKRSGNMIIVERSTVLNGTRHVNVVTIEIPADLDVSTFDEFLSDTENPRKSDEFCLSTCMYVYKDCLELRCEHPSRRAWLQAVTDMRDAGRNGDVPAWYDAWERLLDVCGVGAKRAIQISDVLVACCSPDVAKLIADEERLVPGCPRSVRVACCQVVLHMLTAEMRPCLDDMLRVGGLTASDVRYMVKEGLASPLTTASHDYAEVPKKYAYGNQFSKLYLPRPLVDLMVLADK